MTTDKLKSLLAKPGKDFVLTYSVNKSRPFSKIYWLKFEWLYGQLHCELVDGPKFPLIRLSLIDIRLEGDNLVLNVNLPGVGFIDMKLSTSDLTLLP